MDNDLLEDIKIFKDAVESSSSHIIITNLDGIILYANKAAQIITGFKFSEMKGKTPRIWGTLMPREYYENMWNILKTQKIAFRGELDNRRKNGEVYNALIVISPILNNHGSIIGFIGTEEDITQLKSNANELKSQNDQLKQMNNLMIDRELKMIELKEMLNEAKLKLNKNNH
jgi:PAS domain S-box-containing protein